MLSIDAVPANVGYISAGITVQSLGNNIKVDVFGHLHFARVDPQKNQTSFNCHNPNGFEMK